MFDRLSRSWTLMKASASVLRSDKELLIFPLLSALAAILVVASFAVPAFLSGWVQQLQSHAHEPATRIVAGVVVFGFYLVQYVVMFYFNAALVGAAMIRLEGGDPTVGDGFRIANSKFGAILGYAAIAATVGMILRMIEERAGWVGSIVAGLFGAAWTVLTYLTVPVLVHEDVGPIEAVKKSALLLKKTWGESVIGNGGVGLVFGLLIAFVVVVGIVLSVFAGAKLGGAAAAVFGGLTVVAVMLLALIQAALAGIYSAALYRYAEHGSAGGGFDSQAMAAAFRSK